MLCEPPREWKSCPITVVDKVIGQLKVIKLNEQPPLQWASKAQFQKHQKILDMTWSSETRVLLPEQ